ncbi:hypothetical protein F5Y01DRAFT_319270 [Xylaria sp. FL0043]|nr:hypothetical protein F5Y01DRAFT_319270 [Xylaria sp. FL0043]
MRLTISDSHTISQRLPSYKGKISGLSKDIDSIADDQEFIKSFYFDSFAIREAKIAGSHAKPPEWVFQGVLPGLKTKIVFRSRPKRGNGIFWVRRKAGFGKSTLMKFLSHHPTTLQYLRRWAGSQALVMGNSSSGTQLQIFRSHKKDSCDL